MLRTKALSNIYFGDILIVDCFMSSGRSTQVLIMKALPNIYLFGGISIIHHLEPLPHLIVLPV